MKKNLKRKMKSKKVAITFIVMMLSTTQAHANFATWIQNLFGIKPVDKTKYEPTKEGYRVRRHRSKVKKSEKADKIVPVDISEATPVVTPDATAKVETTPYSVPKAKESTVFYNDGNPFAIDLPPFRAEVGTIWVRKGDTWKLVTNEEFVKEKQAKVRDSYADVLGAKIPIKKSIYVYNLNDGQERMLRANENYSIQVSGYGPRQSIRVNVFNSQGEQLPGDFITLPSNVTAGTDSALAAKALNAIKEIQNAGDITPFCRVDKDYGVVADQKEEDKDTTPSPAKPTPKPKPSRHDDYRKGCEALADGVTPSDRESLVTCKDSLLAWVNGANGNMCSKLERIFSLNEQEQDFLGMLFATRAEAPGGLSGGAPDHLMIMKTLDNRRAAAKRLGWREPLAITDIAFQFDQYSAFNDHDGNNRFDAPGFLKNRGYDKLVDSFIVYQSADWKPPGVINNITHYYSPIAMSPKYHVPSWVRSGIRKNGAKEVTDEIRVNGKPVVNASNSRYGYHKFYTGIDGRNNYSASRDSRRKITHQCH